MCSIFFGKVLIPVTVFTEFIRMPRKNKTNAKRTAELLAQGSSTTNNQEILNCNIGNSFSTNSFQEEVDNLEFQQATFSTNHSIH